VLLYSSAVAVTNLCRDEVTVVLKDKIEAVWGGSFNVNGLGGVLTCGVTGIKAGLSHAPVCSVRGCLMCCCPFVSIYVWFPRHLCSSHVPTAGVCCLTHPHTPHNAGLWP
jgi:Limiting CO2-inducible proteins B/C beta carbonyic anhydrases